MVFDLQGELFQSLLYRLPALGLLLWIARLRGYQAKVLALPRSGDLRSLALALPVLAAVGFLVSSFVATFPGLGPAAPDIEAPQGAAAIAVLALSCLSTGYLEEYYFRFYLVGRLGNSWGKPAAALLFSVALFTLCHYHQGIWGMLNAFLAGLFLSLIFLRYRGLHGLAWAHALYNGALYFL